MSNPMKYIKDLEAAGFQRNQAEAQVQMVLEVLEGDLLTKSDFALFKQSIDHKFKEIELRLTIKIGAINVVMATIIIGVLGWLAKAH